MVRFYKFLAAGAIGPEDRRHWPTPAPGRAARWVQVAEAQEVAARAVDACRVDQLPFWLEDELWEFEFDGGYEEVDRRVVGVRGRLVRRIESWNASSAAEFAAACAQRSKQHAAQVLRRYGAPDEAELLLATDDVAELMAAAYGRAAELGSDVMVVVHDAGDAALAEYAGMSPSLVALVAARTAASAAKASHASPGAAEDEERLWQASWLADRLDLS